MEGTGESIEKWEVDEMMNDGDKNQDGMLDYEGTLLWWGWLAKKIELLGRVKFGGGVIASGAAQILNAALLLSQFTKCFHAV